MSKFNKTNPSSTCPTTNLAGGAAFTFSKEVELIHAVLTTILDEKYYESSDERQNRIVSLIQLLVAEGKVEFVARLALVARREFHLRSVSHILIGELAKLHSGDDLVKRLIVASAERPDDLTEIVAYTGLPLRKQVKRGIRNALLKFDGYQLSKYRGEGKKVSLVDLFNLTHPKVQHATTEQALAWKNLMAGTLKSERTVQTALSNAASDEERTDNLAELVKSGSIGYMALLKNLNNLIKYNVDSDTISAAVKKLTDPEQIKRSKLFPYRFMTAFDAVNGNRALTDAISEAMDVSAQNFPKLPGKTLIAVDISSSMGRDVITKAAIFGAAILKSNVDADFVLFNGSRYEYSGSSRVPILDMVESIRRQVSGGTNTGVVFMTSKVYDRVIILSDNESWQTTYVGTTQQAYEDYKRVTGADPFVYAVDIEGYGTRDMKGGKVFHLAGFSDKVLDFIGAIEQGDSFVDFIKNYEI